MTETTAPTLVEFLLARIADDEATASAFHSAVCTHAALTEGTDCLPSCGQPARIAADCEAKRRLIDWCAPVSGIARVSTGRPGVYDSIDVRHVNEDGEDVLRYLALPYAEHPEYRDDEWRP